MKIGRLLGLGAVALTLLAPQVVVSQQQATTNYQSIVIESFDSPDERIWEVRGSKFVTESFPQSGWVRTWPDALYRVEPEGAELRSLGVQAAFDRQGYNFLEFVPMEENQDGELVDSFVPIPGQVRYLDMWIWGSNFDYYVDVHIRDYRGVVHVLKLGDIRYRGWRNLRVQIPTWIPQDVRYTAEFVGQSGEFQSGLRSLELVKIVLWTRPSERVTGFFVYFDEIKVETDMYRDPFDGEMLATETAVQELWSGAQTAGQN
jgi:hypothetical protein